MVVLIAALDVIICDEKQFGSHQFGLVADPPLPKGDGGETSSNSRAAVIVKSFGCYHCNESWVQKPSLVWWQIRDRKQEMEEKYLTVVEEHVDRLGEMAKNIQEVSCRRCLSAANVLETAFMFGS